MSENDKITEETVSETLPAETETELTEQETELAPADQETDAVPAEPEEEEDIAPEDLKIFGMPRHVFHWTALGAAGGYILAGVVGILGEQMPGSFFESISAKANATVWAVVVGAIGYFFSSRAYKKRKAAEQAENNAENNTEQL